MLYDYDLVIKCKHPRTIGSYTSANSNWAGRGLDRSACISDVIRRLRDPAAPQPASMGDRLWRYVA